MSEGKFLNQVNKQLQSIDDRLSGAATSSVAVSANPSQSRSDNFAGTTSGTTVDASASPKKSFAIQVSSVTAGAAATSWTVVLEGSMDGVTFSTILSHTKAGDTDGGTKFTGSSFSPCKYFRARCTAVVLGVDATAIQAIIIGM